MVVSDADHGPGRPGALNLYRPGTGVAKFADGKLVRSKQSVNESTFELVDLATRSLYTCTEGQNYVIRTDISNTPAYELEFDPAAEFLEDSGSFVDPDKPLTKRETLDGIECWVIELSAKQTASITARHPPDPRLGQVTASEGVWKLWLDAQHGLARKVQYGRIATRYAISEINAVPDREFEVPSGLRVVSGPPLRLHTMSG
jgi:hypothetical protein